MNNNNQSETPYFLGGTVRSRSPAETLKAIQPIIKEAGITRLANVTHLDTLGIPVYTAIRPSAKSLSTSQGKGLQEELAKISAYMEAIEVFFAEEMPYDQPTPAQQVDEKNCLPLDELPMGLLQYQTQTKITPTLWSACQDLHSDDIIYVPSEFLKFDSSQVTPENCFFTKNTTGLASGNCFKEAVCHALFEVIERHATYLYQQLPVSERKKLELHPTQINYDHAQQLLERIYHNFQGSQKSGLKFRFAYLPNPFNIPCFEAIVAEENPFRSLGQYSGYGCHIHPGIAICRAITEAVQSRLTYIAGSRDDMLPKDFYRLWSKLEVIDQPGELEIDFDPTLSLNFESQLKVQLQALKNNHKSPVLAYEFTPPQYPISVVKVFIPRLPV